MHLFYTPDIQLKQLPDEEAGHCVRVLRLKEGDSIALTDGKGVFYCAAITSATSKKCTYEIVETHPMERLWKPSIAVAVAPTKNMERMEWLVEKMTELGVDDIIPILCAHSERKILKPERLVKIAVSAMKQSVKPFLPHIHSMIPFSELMKTPFDGQKFIAHCYKDQKLDLKKAYTPFNNVLILIGPEGDFSEEEVDRALKQGYTPVSLGNSRLRTETAALAACHTIHVLSD